MRPDLPPDYRPCDDEEFMSPLQTEYFRQKLLAWRAELLADSSGTLRHLKEESLLKPDLTDRATLETERYCEETDQPIGIRRLEARPIATLSIEAQERHERMERTYRDE